MITEVRQVKFQYFGKKGISNPRTPAVVVELIVVVVDESELINRM